MQPFSAYLAAQRTADLQREAADDRLARSGRDLPAPDDIDTSGGPATGVRSGLARAAQAASRRFAAIGDRLEPTP